MPFVKRFVLTIKPGRSLHDIRNSLLRSYRENFYVTKAKDDLVGTKGKFVLLAEKSLPEWGEDWFMEVFVYKHALNLSLTGKFDPSVSKQVLCRRYLLSQSE